MIGATEYVKEFLRRHNMAAYFSAESGRISWLIMTGSSNEYVDQSGSEYTISRFSLRPALREMRDFVREWGNRAPDVNVIGSLMWRLAFAAESIWQKHRPAVTMVVK